MMTLTAQLIRTADRYCELAKLSRSRVSTLIFGDGMRLDGVAAGKDLNTRSFERAMKWFAINWPSEAEWPNGVDRPQLVEAQS